MSICLLGKSCCGKDTVAKRLLTMGYGRIVTYTSRPPRVGEIDGIDYNFVSEELFIKMALNGEFAEYRSYKTANGIWYYGTRKDDLQTIANKVIILTPKGFKRMKKCGINNFVGIYLKVGDEAIKERMKKRDDGEECIRRYFADKNDFSKIEKIADYIVDNEKNNSLITACVCKELDEIRRLK